MAVNVGKSQTVRRLMIGSNVVLAVLVVWAIVVLINFIMGRTALMPRDTTRSGQFSVSPRTIKLLGNLKEKVTLTGLYRVEGDEGPAKQQSETQKRQVEDLLRRYADISGSVSYQMLDPVKDNAAKTALLQRLIKQYSGETAKHKKITEDFCQLDPKIIDLVKQERKNLDGLTQANAKVFEENRNLQAILYFFAKYDNNPKEVSQEINNLVAGGDIPAYSDAVEMIQKYCEALRTNLKATSEFFAGEGGKIEGLTPDAKQVFASAPTRYKDVLAGLDNVLAQAPNLPKLELEQIYNQVKQKNAKVILVEAEKSPKVKVLDFNDVWTMSQNRQGPGADPSKPQYDFNGEAAVSSAILSLTQKEKSAVLFVHAGQPSPIKSGFNGQRMSQPPYGAVKDKLEQANFIVEAWDMSTSPEPPEVKDAKHRLFVVVPSQPQRPQQMGAPPMGGYQKAQVDKIEQLIDRGERFMFLVNFAPGMFAPPYPFKETLEKKYGIKADTDKLVLRGITYRDQTFPDTGIAVTRYSDFDITKPIQSLNTTFQIAVPLIVSGKLPDGETVHPLVAITPDMGEYWAESNIMMLMQQRNATKDDNDLPAPFALAVAVENAKTKGKAVVFGDDMFAQDQIVNDGQTVLTSQGLGVIPTNPGNAELFTNSAFWLNDNENMIAVGPRGADVPRIADISDNGQTAWKVFLWVIWPLCALVTGGIVYVVRQR